LQLFAALRADAGAEAEIRRAARRTSRDYAWSTIVERNLLPRVSALAGDRPSAEPRVAPPPRPRRLSELHATAVRPRSTGASEGLSERA
jgi:hypothetical protein